MPSPAPSTFPPRSPGTCTASPPPRTPARPARRYPPEQVPETTLRLLRTMTSPALVVGRFLDVLAWNQLAGALLGEFTQSPQAER